MFAYIFYKIRFPLVGMLDWEGVNALAFVEFY